MRQYNVCDNCGRICYRVMFNGREVWVSHLHPGPATVSCPYGHVVREAK